MLYNNVMLNRHEYREKIVFSLYQHLLLHKSLYDCFANNFEEDEINDYVRLIRDDILINKDNYIAERLNLVEQAILLETVSELKQKLNDEAVVIDEAVILAKEYCDDESYKFINGVLDNICNRSA